MPFRNPEPDVDVLLLPLQTGPVAKSMPAAATVLLTSVYFFVLTFYRDLLNYQEQEVGLSVFLLVKVDKIIFESFCII